MDICSLRNTFLLVANSRLGLDRDTEPRGRGTRTFRDRAKDRRVPESQSHQAITGWKPSPMCSAANPFAGCAPDGARTWVPLRLYPARYPWM